MFALRIIYQRNRRWLVRGALAFVLLVGLAIAVVPMPHAQTGDAAAPMPFAGTGLTGQTEFDWLPAGKVTPLLTVPAAFDSARFAELYYTAPTHQS